MSFDLTSYRIAIEGLRLLVVDLSECHDHIRDLCSEPPSATHRSELSSFGGDLDELHRRADIALSAIKSRLKEDKSSIKALATCYRKDHYPYVYSKKPVAPAPAPCLACEVDQVLCQDQDLTHTCDRTTSPDPMEDF